MRDDNKQTKIFKNKNEYHKKERERDRINLNSTTMCPQVFRQANIT